MATLEFMEKELRKCRYNLEFAVKKNAPSDHIENIKIKIGHYEKVCELLKAGE
jgi:hypothetical protein